MKTITQDELNETVRLHGMWLRGVEGGVRADLREVNLSGQDLRGADLGRAIMSGAIMRRVNMSVASLGAAILYEADMSEAIMSRANMRGAIMSRANMRGAIMIGTIMSEADLSEAIMSGANMSGAIMRRANLYEADMRGAIMPNYAVCPETGAFEAYKKVGQNTILRLLIPSDAKRVSSLVSRKCRASAVTVIDVVSGDPSDMRSRHDSSLIYAVGETFTIANGFNDDIRVEYAAGLHFFMTRREAEEC